MTSLPFSKQRDCAHLPSAQQRSHIPAPSTKMNARFLLSCCVSIMSGRSLVSLGLDSFLFPLLSEGLTLSSTVPPFCNRTVAFFVLRDRGLSYASLTFAFPAALVPLSCLLLPLLVKPLRCCLLALILPSVAGAGRCNVVAFSLFSLR